MRSQSEDDILHVLLLLLFVSLVIFTPCFVFYRHGIPIVIGLKHKKRTSLFIVFVLDRFIIQQSYVHERESNTFTSQNDSSPGYRIEFLFNFRD